MRMLILIVLLAAAHSMLGQAQVKEVAADEFERILLTTEDAVVIDVRTIGELKEHGHIKGAIQIDYFAKDFQKQLLGLDKGKTYLLYCASGYRSGEAAEILKKNGYKEVYNLKSGFGEWKKAGKAVEPFNP